MMAYSLVAASGQGGNFGQNFGINFASSLAGFVVGAAASGIASTAFGGTFWPGLAGAALGGAAGGAATSAMLGGNVGMGALAGLAGGTIGYVGGFAWPLGADAVAGGVSSVIMGGDFGEGAAQGAYYNMAQTIGGILAPMDTVKNQNVQPGDLAFMKADGIFGLGIALLEGGPFSHVKILTDTGNWVSALPKAGVSTFSKASYDNKQAVVLKGFRGNQSVIHAAKSLAASNPPLPYNYVLFGRGRVCSTACGSAISMGGGRQWTGIGPNSQYNTLKMYGD